MKLDLVISGPAVSGKTSAALATLNLVCADLVARQNHSNVLIIAEEHLNLSEFGKYSDKIRFTMKTGVSEICQYLRTCLRNSSANMFDVIVIDNVMVDANDVSSLRLLNLKAEGSVIRTRGAIRHEF